MSKDNIIWAMGAAIVTFLLLGILGLVFDSGQQQPTNQTSYENQTRQEAAEGVFMGSCRAENPPSGFCQCAWDELVDEFTVDEIAEMGRTEDYPMVVYSIKEKCKTEANARNI